MLVNIKFSLNVCKSLTENEINNLSNTARDFFSILFNLLEISLNSVLLSIYGQQKTISKTLTLLLVVFFKYVFMTIYLILTKTVKYKTNLSKKTIEILLNKRFVLDNQQQNEEIITKYVNEHHITVTKNLPVPEPAVIYLLDIFGFRKGKNK